MKTKKEIDFFRRSVGCGIRDKPPIFGKVWIPRYIEWIKEKIKNAPERDALEIKCDPNESHDHKLSLAEKLRTKGPGILKATLTPAGQIQKVGPISVTKTFDMTDNKDFDVDVEALFNKL